MNACPQFATNVRKRREEKGLSQVELARLAGTNQSHISMIECGEKLVALPMLVSIANALDCSTDRLLAESPEKLST